jgi:hypothetical protein
VRAQARPVDHRHQVGQAGELGGQRAAQIIGGQIAQRPRFVDRGGVDDDRDGAHRIHDRSHRIRQ